MVVRILTITFVAPTHTTAGSCGDETIACLTDANCRGALVELQSCGLTDQVCQYKVITERESELFERFSSCVLQKYNCLNNTADIPLVPDPEPMAVWRGEALTHEAAESCLIGWMAAPSAGGGGDAWSWRVIAGQNAAYDAFPCQYQIFYRDRGGMWYDPVFKVCLDDGSSVWRRRHYRVRRERNAAAGRFAFTVLDSGIISDERWTVVDVADDLRYGVLYYRGAASAAGQSYTVRTPTISKRAGDRNRRLVMLTLLHAHFPTPSLDAGRGRREPRRFMAGGRGGCGENRRGAGSMRDQNLGAQGNATDKRECPS